MKINCSNCHKNKTKKHFWVRKDTKLGYETQCKECRKKIEKPCDGKKKYSRWKELHGKNCPIIRKNSFLKFNFGITLEQYNILLEKQSGVCSICKKKEKQKHHITGKRKSLTVDHDHKLNKIRGLLCSNCNRALGLFGDSLENIKCAVKYLENN